MKYGKLMPWGLFPSFPQTPHPCHWRSDLPNLLTQLGKNHRGILPFGNGRSYGDSCLAVSDHVVHTRTLDRFISADWENGVIIAESGMTLEELLALTIPRGWFLPVTPGTKFITLGGALANDIHGKNHHRRGTFGQHVKRFSLVRSDRLPLICSLTENTDLFAATIGGLGLTGIIEWLELKLIPIQSSFIDALHIRFDSLNEFFALSSELDDQHEYTVAWIDCLAKGRSTGRGVYIAGDHSRKGDLSVNYARKMRIPFTPPISMINPLTLRLFNSVYYQIHKTGRNLSVISYEPFFYPLDRILHWNRIYGSRGFQQYQCVIPDRSAHSAVHELLNVIAAAGSGSFLAILKRCGGMASPGLLSFPFPGVSLALDFPQKEKLSDRLFPRLDAIVREAGGRLYPAKDAHMSADDFRHFYPAWNQVEKLRDPALYSRFWQRVIP
jgi:FAD/FMN-containing dehydrogenase